MTILLDQAVEAARVQPAEAQGGAARLAFQLAGDEEAPVILSAEERAALDLSKAAAARGEFAMDEQAHAVWAKATPGNKCANPASYTLSPFLRGEGRVRGLGYLPAW